MGLRRSAKRISLLSESAFLYLDISRLSFTAAAASLMFFEKRALFKALAPERTIGGRNMTPSPFFPSPFSSLASPVFSALRLIYFGEGKAGLGNGAPRAPCSTHLALLDLGE